MGHDTWHMIVKVVCQHPPRQFVDCSQFDHQPFALWDVEDTSSEWSDILPPRQTLFIINIFRLTWPATLLRPVAADKRPSRLVIPGSFLYLKCLLQFDLWFAPLHLVTGLERKIVRNKITFTQNTSNTNTNQIPSVITHNKSQGYKWKVVFRLSTVMITFCRADGGETIFLH